MAELTSNLQDVAELTSQLASANVAQSTSYYVQYQRWRVLTNWHILINKVWDGVDFNSSESNRARRDARERAARLLENNLVDEIEKARNMVPPDHSLFQLMRRLEGQ